MTNTVSPQVTDAVTQVNVKVVARPPPWRWASLYQTAAHSTACCSPMP